MCCLCVCMFVLGGKLDKLGVVIMIGSWAPCSCLCVFVDFVFEYM